MTQSLGGTLLSMVLSILPHNSDVQGLGFRRGCGSAPPECLVFTSVSSLSGGFGGMVVAILHA